MNIEVFPAEKSCEQGCSICPLARKEKAVTAEVIDPKVQESFSLLEDVLHKKNISYTMHFTSSFQLFPKLAHPELIRMSRFETSKDIKLNGNTAHFSQGVRKLLADNGINPKIVGFSVVPDYPVISAGDARTISELIREIASWHFAKKHKTIDVTVRSNLIRAELFEEVSGHLFDMDKIYLKNSLLGHGKLYKWNRRAPLRDGKHDRIYYNEYWARSGTNKIIITNRVLSAKPAQDSEKGNVEQAFFLTPGSRSYADFAIAPKGVMLMHASIAINNPVLWLSHSDFKKILEKRLQKTPGFSVLKLIRNLILQNAVMYRVLMEYQKEKKIKLTSEQLMALFEDFRSKIKKFK